MTKYLIVLTILLTCLLATACTSKTDYGPCIGAFDDKNPKLNYKVNTTNVVVGVIFFELVIPPVIVLLYEVQCPTGDK